MADMTLEYIAELPYKERVRKIIEHNHKMSYQLNETTNPMFQIKQEFGEIPEIELEILAERTLGLINAPMVNDLLNNEKFTLIPELGFEKTITASNLSKIGVDNPDILKNMTFLLYTYRSSDNSLRIIPFKNYSEVRTFRRDKKIDKILDN